MKTSPSSARRLLAGSAAIFALGLAGSAHAQQAEAPVKPKAAAPKAMTPKVTGAKKPRLKNLTPRMVTATEAATGKPLTPELKAQLTEAYRARAAAIAAADEKYYADFAKLAGLSVEQAREIDKPARAKAPTVPKVETKTDADELTTGEATNDTPVSPVNP